MKEIQSELTKPKTRNPGFLLTYCSLLYGHRIQYLAEENNKLNKVQAQRNSRKDEQNRNREAKKLNQNHSKSKREKINFLKIRYRKKLSMGLKLNLL